MEDRIKKLKSEALAEIEKIASSREVQELQDRLFNKKSGLFAQVSKGMKDVSDEMRPKMGALFNAVKGEVEERLGQKIREFGNDMVKDAGGEWIDPTVSIDRYKIGNLHPVTHMMREIEDAFLAMGFKVLDGPELESDHFNFEALNIPDWHPARDDADTFYIDTRGEQAELLRTHTSPMQIRAMLAHGAPLKAVVPGRVFRNEATDMTHDHTFYQFEGIMIDEHITIANLIATLKELVSAIYKKDMQVRLRPGYFPFVEPGFELDIYSEEFGKWIEMGGSGMIHPNVLKHGGIDPQKYSGFAFGMGVTRLVMLKYGITDIRLLHSGDLRFLKQF